MYALIKKITFQGLWGVPLVLGYVYRVKNSLAQIDFDVLYCRKLLITVQRDSFVGGRKKLSFLIVIFYTYSIIC